MYLIPKGTNSDSRVLTISNIKVKVDGEYTNTITCTDTPTNILQTIKSNTWIMLCCGLAVCLLIETIILIFRRD